MADLSQYSTEQLQGMLNAPPQGGSDLSGYSSEQLVQILNQQSPENERPVATPNQGSHPTYSAPSYNANPFTALIRGVNTGAAGIQNMSQGLAGRFLGLSKEETNQTKDYVNSRIFKPETIAPSRPGTGANIAEKIGESASGGLPAIATSAVLGPSLGWGTANAADAFANYENPFMPFVKGAVMGKGLQIAGKAGSTVLNPLAKTGKATKEFTNRAGSALGGGAAGSAVSGGDPAAIIQGAGLGAMFPQSPLSKKDIPYGNEIAHGIMKDYMKPWAKDFKYMHDPVRGWLNEGLVANNANEAAVVAKARLDDIGHKIGETINNSSKSGQTSDYSGVLKPLQDKIIELSKSPKSNASAIKRIQDAIDDISLTLQKSGTDLTPQKAFELKKQIDDLTKWTGNAGDDKPANAALQDSYREVRNKLNNQIPELESFNQRYGDMSEAVKRLQYRADASNPMLKGISLVKDVGIAGVLGHGNPIATAAILAAEQAGKTGAVKTRLANALYDRPNFPGVPNPVYTPQVLNPMMRFGRSPQGLPAPLPAYLQQRQNMPMNQFSVPQGTPNETVIPARGTVQRQGALSDQSSKPLGLPNIFADRGNTPPPSNVIRLGNQNSGEPIAGERPGVPYTPGKEAIINSRNELSGFNPREDAPAAKKISPEAKAEAKKQIDAIWYEKLTGQKLPNIGKKAAVIGGATALGSGMFGSQAEAGQDKKIDISKINIIESSGRADQVGDNGKAFGLNQIHLGTLSDYNKANKTSLTKDNLFDPDVNNKVAEWYYNTEAPRLLKAFKIPDTLENRISVYNEGIGNLKKRLKNGKPMPAITKRYIKKYRGT